MILSDKLNGPFGGHYLLPVGNLIISWSFFAFRTEIISRFSSHVALSLATMILLVAINSFGINQLSRIENYQKEDDEDFDDYVN